MHGKYLVEICPVCNQRYTPSNHKSPHHITPRRFFGDTDNIFYLCRNCHNQLEWFIPLYTKLTEKEYYQILGNFIKFKRMYEYA